MAGAGNVRDAVPVQVLGFCALDSRIPMLFPNDKYSADLCAAQDLTHLQPAAWGHLELKLRYVAVSQGQLCFSSLSWKKDQTCAGAKQIPPWLHLHGSESPQPLWSWLQKPQSPANIAVLSAFQCGHSFGHPATLAQRYNSQTGAAWNLG